MSYSDPHNSRRKLRPQNIDIIEFSHPQTIPTFIESISSSTSSQTARNTRQSQVPLNLSMNQGNTKRPSDADTEPKQRKCKKLLKPLIVRNKIGEICSRKVIYFSEYLKASSPQNISNGLAENTELQCKCHICYKSFAEPKLLHEHECLKLLATNDIMKHENTEIVDCKKVDFELKLSNDENSAINMTIGSSNIQEDIKTSEIISEEKIAPKSPTENVLQNLQPTDLRYVTPKMRLKMFKYKLIDADRNVLVKSKASDDVNLDKKHETSSCDTRTPQKMPECETEKSSVTQQSLTFEVKDEPEFSDQELMIDLEKEEKVAEEEDKEIEEQLKQKTSALKCNHCNQSFKKAISLSLHLRHVKYCNVCEKKLTSSEFSSHVKNFHAVKHICKYCSKDFKTELQKQKHEKVGKCRENFCRFCNIKLESRLAFETHIVQNHASKQKCPFCDRVLKRRILRHYHKHTSVTPWLCVCKICSKNFSFKAGHTCTQVQELEKPKKPVRNIQCRKLSFTDHDSSHNAKYQTIKNETQSSASKISDETPIHERHPSEYMINVR